MQRRTVAAAVIVIGILGGGPVHAHHALEYIEMESYLTPARGEKVFYLQYDYLVGDSDRPDLDRWELTPGLSYGITDRLMFDVHTHFAKFGLDYVEEDRRAEFEPHGPSPFIEAAAMALQYRLTEKLPVNLALAATMEIPFSRAEKLLGDDEYVYTGTLIASREFGVHGNISFNLNAELEGSETEWSWALGVKTPISADPHGIAAGIEIRGDFEGESWSVLPGVYAPIGATVILKSGLEFGRAKDDDGQWVDNLRANVGLMYRF